MTTLNPERLQLPRDSARALPPRTEREPVVEKWYGWRPMTYDRLPIIDRSPRLANVWHRRRSQHARPLHGPATGKLIAECLTGTKPHIALDMYSLFR